ncbi:MAG: hypothetical protein KatS3mg042_0576 [Rhodothermaceae bacterium]|nr:MAG: hypothetical protein KatS3mg042_0576 [Rhodothermaceae bacterium]
MALDEAADFRTAVLSCEGFWLFSDDEVVRLRDGLGDREVEVILYLRRPASYLPSSYRQGIKQTGRTQSVGAYLAGVRKEDRMNYPRLLERWGRHFSLRVRAYEAVRGAIEADFMQAIGAPLDRIDVRRRVVNVTPSDGAHQVILWANRMLPAFLARRVCQSVRRSGWRFDVLPPIDDEPLRRYGREVVQAWDLDVMRRYVPEDDLKVLLATEEE